MSAPVPFSVRLEASHEAHKKLKETQAYRDAQHERVGDDAVSLIGVLVAHGKESKEFGEALAALYGDVQILKMREELVASAVKANTEAAAECGRVLTRRVKSVRVVCAGCAKFLSGDPSSDVVSHGVCERGQACYTEAVERRERAKVGAA